MLRSLTRPLGRGRTCLPGAWRAPRPWGGSSCSAGWTSIAFLVTFRFQTYARRGRGERDGVGRVARAPQRRNGHRREGDLLHARPRASVGGRADRVGRTACEAIRPRAMWGTSACPQACRGSLPALTARHPRCGFSPRGWACEFLEINAAVAAQRPRNVRALLGRKGHAEHAPCVPLMFVV